MGVGDVVDRDAVDEVVDIHEERHTRSSLPWGCCGVLTARRVGRPEGPADRDPLSEVVAVPGPPGCACARVEQAVAGVAAVIAWRRLATPSLAEHRRRRGGPRSSVEITAGAAISSLVRSSASSSCSYLPPPAGRALLRVRTGRATGPRAGSPRRRRRAAAARGQPAVASGAEAHLSRATASRQWSSASLLRGSASVGVVRTAERRPTRSAASCATRPASSAANGLGHAAPAPAGAELHPAGHGSPRFQAAVGLVGPRPGLGGEPGGRGVRSPRSQRQLAAQRRDGGDALELLHPRRPAPPARPEEAGPPAGSPRRARTWASGDEGRRPAPTDATGRFRRSDSATSRAASCSPRSRRKVESQPQQAVGPRVEVALGAVVDPLVEPPAGVGEPALGDAPIAARLAVRRGPRARAARGGGPRPGSPPASRPPRPGRRPTTSMVPRLFRACARSSVRPGPLLERRRRTSRVRVRPLDGSRRRRRIDSIRSWASVAVGEPELRGPRAGEDVDRPPALRPPRRRCDRANHDSRDRHRQDVADAHVVAGRGPQVARRLDGGDRQSSTVAGDVQLVRRAPTTARPGGRSSSRSSPSRPAWSRARRYCVSGLAVRPEVRWPGPPARVANSAAAAGAPAASAWCGERGLDRAPASRERGQQPAVHVEARGPPGPGRPPTSRPRARAGTRTSSASSTRSPWASGLLEGLEAVRRAGPRARPASTRAAGERDDLEGPLGVLRESATTRARTASRHRWGVAARARAAPR